MTTDGLAEKRERVRELLLRRQRAERVAEDRIEPVDRTGPLPLSAQQEGLWSLQQADPAATTYHLPLVLRLVGELDLAALRTALFTLAVRHEGLRTRFPADGAGVPRQVVDPPAPIPVEVADVAPDTVDAAVAEVLRRPFDLAAGPVVRCWVGRLGPAEHVLIFLLHHIVVDGWSFGILTGELAECYDAAVDGREPDLPESALQPVDHAAWQRRTLADGGLTEQLDHWREKLSGAPTLDLPTDFPRPAAPTGAGAGFSWEVPDDVGQGVRELAGAEQASLLAVLVAGLLVVLHRQTGQDDLVVGSVFSGRTRAQLESVVGYLAVTSVLRTDVGGDPTFRELIGRANDTVLDALGNQDVPFPVLVDELKPERVPGRNPLFQVSLSFAPAAATTAGFGLRGLDVGPYPYSVPDSRFDLRLEVTDAPGGGLAGYTEFSTELFTHARIERLVGQLRAVLAEVVATPDARLSELRVLPPEEWRRAVVTPNRTAVEWPDARDVPELIAERSAAAPEAVAVRCGDEELGYRELASRSARLAGLLRDRYGVRRDVPVGVCARRSVDLMVGLLAVWKAGGAYVPLDPDLPIARVHGMAEQAGVPVVLCQRDLLDTAPAGVGAVALDDPGSFGVDEVDRTGEDAGLDRLAYVMFTSGSTGTPKGVMVGHRGLANRLHWMQAEYGLGPGDVVVQKTPFSFDVSVWELFWPLMVGATLVLARPDGHRDAAYLAGLLADQDVTVAHFVPSMLRRFLEVDLPPLPALRRVICSGEALPADLARAFGERLPEVELHNLYGPTEASIDVTAWPVPTGFAGRSVPIGRPIANISCYVLDADLNLSPVGAAGQLYLAGVGLARGYLGRPDLTADRFVPCPYGDPGERMYATGDVVAWSEDGALDYLGRTDRQIKIRGLRIELAEVEHVLAGHPAVAAAAVVTTADAAGEPQLAGYLVPADPEDPDSLADGAVRGYLAERLPIHMIPAFLITLPALPTTRNGKLDTAALPPPTGAVAETDTRPLTATEAAVAGLWRTVLDLPEDRQLRPRDSFFGLGGNSLHAARLATAMRDTYGLDMGIRRVYLSPTLEALTVAVEDAVMVDLVEAAAGDPVLAEAVAVAAPAQGSPLIAIRSSGSKPPLFLVHAAAGSAVPYLALAPLLDAEQPLYAFEAPGVSSGEPVHDFGELADRYVAVVREERPDGPYRLGGWSTGGVVALEMAARLRAAGAEVQRLVLLDSWAPPAAEDLPDHLSLLAGFCSDVASIRGCDPPPLDLDALRQLPEESQVAAVVATLTGAGLVDAGLQEEIRRPMRVFVATSRGYHGHRLSPYDRPVTLLLARDADRSDDHDDPQLAQWRRYAVAGLDVHLVPGTHYTMLQPPHDAQLACILTGCLDPDAGEGT